MKIQLMAAGLALVGFVLPGWAGAPAPDKKPQEAAKTAQASAVEDTLGTADAPPLGADSRLVRLANGLTVLVKEDRRFPLVSTRILVPAGSADETPQEAGISHMLEHMVFKGTAKRPKGEVSREVEAAGGYLNAMTTFDRTEYIIDLPASSWKLGMDIVRDMAFHPTLDAAELESEKEVIVAELKRGEDSPQSVLFQATQAEALHGTPYARPIIGYEKTIRDVTVQAMRDYLRKWYQPRNMVLVVAGDIKADEVLAEAEATFGAYTNESPLTLNQPINAGDILPASATGLQPASASGKGTVPGVTVRTGPWNKVYLTVALPVPGMLDARSSTLDVLATLLGGDRTSFLYRKYRYEQQLVDSISAYNLSLERVGLFLISAELDADKLEPFWKAFCADMAGLKADAFTPAQLDRAKLNFEDGLLRSKEELGDLATHLGYFQLYFGGEQGEINALQQMKSVDTAMLQDVLQWFVPGRYSTVALVPARVAQERPDLAAMLAKGGLNTGATARDKPVVAKVGASEIIDLGKGRKVVLIPDSTMPHFAMDMLYAGGEALLEPSQQGLSALTARVLTKGTASRDNTALTEFLADRAAYMGASTGRTAFSISLTGQRRFSPELFGALADVLQAPAFRAEEVSREKKAQLAAIQNTEEQPMGLAFRKLSPFLFPHSVYGYETLGSAKGVEGFDRAAVASFWDKQKTRPWVLSIAGDFDREAVLAFANSLPVPSEARVQLQAPQWNKDHSLTLTLPERQQAHLMLVFKTAPLRSKDTPALNLLEAALGGMGGPLFSKLRDEKGLGYTVRMFNRQDEENGYVVLYIGTDPRRLEEAEAGFATIISELHDTLLTKADLARGVSQLEGDYYRARQTLAARADEAASLVFTNRSPEYFKELVAKAGTLTPEDLREVVRKYFTLKDVYTITVMPN